MTSFEYLFDESDDFDFVKILVPVSWVSLDDTVALIKAGILNENRTETDSISDSLMNIHVDREVGFAVGSRRCAFLLFNNLCSTQPRLKTPEARLNCEVLVVGPRCCLVSCHGYDLNLSQRELSYTAIPDFRYVYHSGMTLDCIVKTYDRKRDLISVSIKETAPNPYDGAEYRHPVQSHRQTVIQEKYRGGVFCNMADGVTVMCSYSFHYDDSAFRIGDRVMLIIQHYDDSKKQIYGIIVAKC